VPLDAKQFVGKMLAKMEDRYATVRRTLAGSAVVMLVDLVAAPM